MNRIFKKLALGAFVLGLSTGAAVAIPIAVTYDINGTFQDPYNVALPAGTVSGTFAVLGDVNGSNVFTNYAITAANINVTGYTDLGGHTFSNLTYSLLNSTVNGAGLFNYFQFDTAGGDELRFYYSAAGLSTTGGSFAFPFSYDHQPAGGNRILSKGGATQQIAAVPEPSSIALLGAGLALLAGFFAFGHARKPVTATA
jgi:hypothetical protein